MGQTDRHGRRRLTRDAGLIRAAHVLLFSGQSVRTVLERSARWHARQPAITAVMATFRGEQGTTEVSWPPAFPDHQDGDIALVILRDEAALVAEGARTEGGLSHCVGGYAGSCRAGRSRIASIRHLRADGTWGRLSTAELAFEMGDVRVIQHRGGANATPPETAHAFLRHYLVLLRNGHLPFTRDDLRPVADPDARWQRSGYDTDIPGAWESVHDAWKPVIPAHLRNHRREDYRRHVEPLRDASAPRWLSRPVVLSDEDLSSPAGAGQ